MKRYASVRFGDALDVDAREAAAGVLRSAGATPTSWQTTTARTYLAVEFEAAADPALIGNAAAALSRSLRERFPAARFDHPPFVVLRARIAHGQASSRIVDALSGNGRPAGIVDTYDDDGAVVIELDAARTPVALIVALLDVELGGTPAERSNRCCLSMTQRWPRLRVTC